MLELGAEGTQTTNEHINRWTEGSMMGKVRRGDGGRRTNNLGAGGDQTGARAGGASFIQLPGKPLGGLSRGWGGWGVTDHSSARKPFPGEALSFGEFWWL